MSDGVDSGMSRNKKREFDISDQQLDFILIKKITVKTTD